MNCYNGEKFLHQALDSVKRQTYQNWELIFWDNQSNDSSKEIFFSFNDGRFKYFLAPEHTKLFKARNLAISKCQGDYIAFLDVDDYWFDTKLEIQLRDMVLDEKIMFSFTKYLVFDENTDKFKINTQEELNYNKIKNIFENYQVGLSTVIVKKEILDQKKFKFNDDYNIIGDFDLFTKILVKYNFKFLAKALTVYRWHSSNLSTILNHEELNELNSWILDNKKNKKLEKKYLRIVSKKIKFMNIIKQIRDKNFFKSLLNIIIYPLGIRKFKLLTFFIKTFFIKKKN